MKPHAWITVDIMTNDDHTAPIPTVARRGTIAELSADGRIADGVELRREIVVRNWLLMLVLPVVLAVVLDVQSLGLLHDRAVIVLGICALVPEFPNEECQLVQL